MGLKEGKSKKQSNLRLYDTVWTLGSSIHYNITNNRKKKKKATLNKAKYCPGPKKEP